MSENIGLSEMILNLNILSFLASIHLVRSKVNLVILHDNDILGRFDEVSPTNNYCFKRLSDAKLCLGGMIRAAEVVKRNRELEGKGVDKVLYYLTGGIFSGSVWFAIHGWNISAEFINLLAPDAVSIGISEFILGMEEFKNYVLALKCPIVATNVDATAYPEFRDRIKKSHIFEVKGFKIGVMGYTDRMRMQYISDPFIVHDEATSILKESQVLLEKGVNYLIVLGNSGYELEKKVAEEVDIVDLVIGGGGPEIPLLYNGPSPIAGYEAEEPYPKVIEHPFNNPKIPIVRTFGRTRFIGQLNISLNEKGHAEDFKGQPIYLSNDMPKNDEAQKLLDRYAEKVEEFNKKIVGRTRVLIDGGPCDEQECNFGNLLADAFVDYVTSTVSSRYWSAAPLAVFHAALIGGSNDEYERGGNLSYISILDILPYDTSIGIVSIKGEDLKSVLENSASHVGTHALPGGFLQLSGFRMEFNRQKQIGERVISARVLCRECDDPKYEYIRNGHIYRLIAPSTLIGGLWGYTEMKENTFGYEEVDKTAREVLYWHFEKKKFSNPEIDGRIRFVHETEVKSIAAAFFVKVPGVLILVTLLSYIVI